MTEELNKLIREELLKLPTEGSGAISSFNWVKITEEIGKKYNLSESELNHFQAETAIILFGLEEIESYIENVENNVHTNKETSEKMVTESFEKIFDPLKKLIEENVKKNMLGKEMTWDQSVDFILSGGDYSVLINKQNSPHSANPQRTANLLGGKSMQDMKDKLIN